MNEAYPLRYTQSGMIFIDPGDDCDKVVDAMLSSHYDEEFCFASDWDPLFIARLMKSGFLVMSVTFHNDEEDSEPVSEEEINSVDLVLPKLHLVRSVLFFQDLHIKHSIRPYLSRYELRFDTDFETVVKKCLQTHGEDWLTPSLVESLYSIRKQPARPSAVSPVVYPLPVSFSLYRNGQLIAGEFGVICGRVYTSYSGFKEENNAGTVQMILMVKALEEAGFDFLDFGMPLNYKTDLGARDISPEQFVKIFRSAQI
ncbi:MAG: GNAT family N-acetyltransferase [Treponema sp.]|nr:GNAT family N-acetyltransferase [Treponema sp.]